MFTLNLINDSINLKYERQVIQKFTNRHNGSSKYFNGPIKINTNWCRNSIIFKGKSLDPTIWLNYDELHGRIVYLLKPTKICQHVKNINRRQTHILNNK